MTAPRLQLSHISKQYPAVKANDDVSLTVPFPLPWVGGCSNAAPLVWKASGVGFTSVKDCDPSTGLYPVPSPGQWSKDTSFSGSFQYGGARLPRVCRQPFEEPL